jgi:hypothetical protein
MSTFYIAISGHEELVSFLSQSPLMGFAKTRKEEMAVV